MNQDKTPPEVRRRQHLTSASMAYGICYLTMARNKATRWGFYMGTVAPVLMDMDIAAQSNDWPLLVPDVQLMGHAGAMREVGKALDKLEGAAA